MASGSLSQLKFWTTFATCNRFSYDKIPDLSGKVAIVTGANSGLGYVTTVALAAHGANVFLACRSEERANDAIQRAKEEIKEKYPGAAEPRLEFLELDLNDLRKSRQAAKNFLAKNLPLHILVCNSGIIFTPFELSADGIETQFAVNHMGHFVFTTTLLERIKESQPSRVVILSSVMHEFPLHGGIDFYTINDETKSSPYSRYGRSKLANLLFAKALARRLENERVYVNTLHPGYVKTDLGRYSSHGFRGLLLENIPRAIFGMSPADGALTQLYLATSPEIETDNIRGRYFIPVANEILPTKYACNENLQERLWKFSEELVIEKIGDY